MKHKRKSPYAVFLLGLAAAAMPAVGAETDAATGWTAVKGCAQQVTERARHSCLDQVLRDAGLLTPEMSEQQQRRNFGLGNTTAPAPPVQPVAPAPQVSTAVPAPAASAPPKPAPQAAEAPPERLEVEVASVATSPDRRKLIITTTDGAVWRQTEDIQVLPMPVAGDQMTLRKGALGGYFCRFGKGITYRCARSR